MDFSVIMKIILLVNEIVFIIIFSSFCQQYFIFVFSCIFATHLIINKTLTHFARCFEIFTPRSGTLLKLGSRLIRYGIRRHAR